MTNTKKMSKKQRAVQGIVGGGLAAHGTRGLVRELGPKKGGAIAAGSIAGGLAIGYGIRKAVQHHETKAYVAQGKAKNAKPRVNNDINKAVARSKTTSSANTKNAVMHTRTKGRVGKK